MPDTTDHYLRFDNEAAGNAALAAAGLDRDHATGWAIDRIGTIWTDDDPPVALSGWHLNIRMVGQPLPTSLEAFEMFPETPNRRFASC